MADREQPRPDEREPNPDELGTDWQAAWETEDNYWQENFSSRPYALGPDYYDRFRPAYRYGFESARDGLGRTWDEIRAAVRDAWDRVTGGRTAESEERRPQIRE